MFEVLVTDKVPEGFCDVFSNLGYIVDYQVSISNISLYHSVPKYQVIVMNSHMDLSKSMLEKATQLKYILRPGSGLDNVDLDYCKAQGITVLSSPEANANAVGEHSLGLLLGLMRNIPRSFFEIKDFKWIRHENTGEELSGKTVGIIGYGHTGSAFAQKLSGMGVKILVYDKYKSGFGDDSLLESTLEDIQSHADVISFHIPSNIETVHYFDAKFLSAIQKNIYLLNTSRGNILDLSVVLEGLQNGKIKGAGIDVLPNEKFDTLTESEISIIHDLIDFNKVILTPHIAGWTVEARANIFWNVLNKFKELIK
jgi:D-3-phosphoglycerate dehydrogenase